MDKMLKEYTYTTANSVNCYKTINNYGDTCFYSSTVSPQPVSMVPQIFCKLKPHDMPPQEVVIKRRCSNYKTLSN